MAASQPMIPFLDLKTQFLALKPNIMSRLEKIFDHTGFINGPEVAELERALCKYTGAPHALACSNGTDAILIPLMALGIGPGDEVITTTFSFIATAEMIHMAGATPVYIDTDPRTYNIDVRQIEKRITSKTKAILPVSLYGQASAMDEINALAKKHDLAVIEDAAQSFGGTYKGKKSCNLSQFASTSFFPAKPLGGYGDGGAIFTQDEKFYTIMKEIREHGSEKRYYHTRLGMNARLDTIQCAILLAKLERFPWEVEQRERIARTYATELASCVGKKGFTLPVVLAEYTSGWAQFTVEVEDRDAFQKQLGEKGVSTSIHYPSIMPDQPWYKANLKSEPQDWNVSRRSASRVISLPMYPDLTDENLTRVIAGVKECL